ncbi:hypothetical protein VP01_10535g1, partial [Puccinia sorghi]
CGEYKSQFKSLVYPVKDVEDTCIEKNIVGLNPRIICQATGKDWMTAKTLNAQMTLASEAAAQLDLLALLPPETSSSHHHPSNCPVLNPTNPPCPPKDPDSMEIDTACVLPATHSLLDISCSLLSSECFQAFVDQIRSATSATVLVVQLLSAQAPPLNYQPIGPVWSLYRQGGDCGSQQLLPLMTWSCGKLRRTKVNKG